MRAGLTNLVGRPFRSHIEAVRHAPRARPQFVLQSRPQAHVQLREQEQHDDGCVFELDGWIEDVALHEAHT